MFQLEEDYFTIYFTKISTTHDFPTTFELREIEFTKF